MNYSEIVNKSFSTAWKYKSLWIFGLFVGSSGSAFNWQRGDEEGFDLSALGGVFENQTIPMEIFTPLAMIAMAVGLVIVLLGFVAAPALIDGVNKISRGGQYNWSDSFSVGVDNFFRFFGLTILLFLAIFFSFLGYIGIGVVAFLIHWVVGVMSLLVLLPAAIVITIFIINTFALAERAIVVRGVSIGDGLAEGYYLFRHNIGKNFAIAFIAIGLAIGLGIMQFIMWAIIGLPIAAIVLASGLGVLAAFGMAFAMGLPVSLIVGGFVGTTLSNIYTMFYFELLEPTDLKSTPVSPEPPAGPITS